MTVTVYKEREGGLVEEKLTCVGGMKRVILGGKKKVKLETRVSWCNEDEKESKLMRNCPLREKLEGLGGKVGRDASRGT